MLWPEIRTRYLGPTDTLGSRIVATTVRINNNHAPNYRLTVPYNHALSIDGNHAAAAMAMLNKHPDVRERRWDGKWVPVTMGRDRLWCWQPFTGPWHGISRYGKRILKATSSRFGTISRATGSICSAGTYED